MSLSIIPVFSYISLADGLTCDEYVNLQYYYDPSGFMYPKKHIAKAAYKDMETREGTTFSLV